MNLLQEDLACSGRQAEAAQQSSDGWQQTVHHLRAELDREEHAAEVDGMQAEVMLLQCSLSPLAELIENVKRSMRLYC